MMRSLAATLMRGDTSTGRQVRNAPKPLLYAAAICVSQVQAVQSYAQILDFVQHLKGSAAPAKAMITSLRHSSRWPHQENMTLVVVGTTASGVTIALHSVEDALKAPGAGRGRDFVSGIGLQDKGGITSEETPFWRLVVLSLQRIDFFRCVVRRMCFRLCSVAVSALYGSPICLFTTLYDILICFLHWPWDGLKLSHVRYAPGFKSRSSQSHLSFFRTSSWAVCALGFWWFPLYELHVYSSMWSEAEALSEYGVGPG
jgi:hypothetical protein